MQTDLIIISEYCKQTNLDPDFFGLLEDNDLITIYVEAGNRYFPSSQLHDLEKYIRFYYDLSINMEGIDVIRNLQDKMRSMQNEISLLRDKLRLYESNLFEDL